MNVLHRPVLVLNAAWVPVGTTNVRTALSLLFTTYSDTGEPKSRILDPRSLVLSDPEQLLSRTINADHIVRTPNAVMPVPEAIVLSRLATIPAARGTPRFSRRFLFARDNYQCAYCGATEPLTVEHITPVARGGKSSFTNCVTACHSCNSRKGSRTPQEAGMRIRSGVRLEVPRASFFRDKYLAKCARNFQELVRRSQEPHQPPSPT